MTQQCSHTHCVAVIGYTYEFKTRDSPGDESTGECSSLRRLIQTGSLQGFEKIYIYFFKFKQLLTGKCNSFWLILMKYRGFI